MQALVNKSNHFPMNNSQSNVQIGSGLFSLKEVTEYDIQFNIPIYQRLYVWKIDQIRTLLEDIKNAFQNEITDFYFLGAVMLSSTIKDKIDLVDGQQRFTTLWLICDTLSDIEPSLKKFTYQNNEPRIHFSIRDKAQDYLKDKNTFKDFLNEKGELIDGIEAEVSEIIPLAIGRKNVEEIINDFKKDDDFDVKKFGEFIFKNVFLTYTILPGESDLNRVFEAMNNRGKQLEHHEILKSRLLEKIDKSERNQYSLIWDACSKMNDYIEKNIKEVANLSWKEILGSESILHKETEDKVIDLINVDVLCVINVKKSQEIDPIGLFDVLKDDAPLNPEIAEKSIIETDYVSKSVKSIISFPSFLLHALRVHQLCNSDNSNYNSAEVNDKELLNIFNVNENFYKPEDAKKFILLLWNLRVLFDKYVIKWIYNEEEKEVYHSIEYIQISKSIIKNKNGSENENLSVQRVDVTEKELIDLMKLQGMLYHSQEMTTQYWLTPFLYFIYSDQQLSNANILFKLEKLENALFYSSVNTSKLKDRTFKIIFIDESEWLNNLVDTNIYFKECKGTDYPNYIFYKLEYILWKYKEEICYRYKLDIEKWKRYRLTAKNSVEHIFPQTTKDENKHISYINDKELLDFNQLEKKPIDDFGNLVLLSPGMNSEYSNKPYKEKRGQFISKQEIDSLKSDIIFANEVWNWALAEEHRNVMISYLEKYINQLKTTL